MKNKVSVITPTFNRGYILPNMVRSVLGQTFPNWELVIVDDGSTDDTKSLIDDFGDKRIKYYYQKHKGQSAARNLGLQKASGEWICYLDSDNEFLPIYLQVVMDMLGKSKEALYAMPKAKRTLELYKGRKLLKVINQSGEFPKNLTPKDIFMWKIHVDCNGFIHSRKILEEGIKFDERLKRMEDWDFLMQVCEKFPDNFLYVPTVLYKYHQRYDGDGVVSNTTYIEWARTFEYIFQKHKSDKLMKGQKWYPERVQKYKKLEEEYKKGIVPKPYLRYFI